MSQFPNARPTRRRLRGGRQHRCAFKIVELHVGRSVFRTEVRRFDGAATGVRSSPIESSCCHTARSPCSLAMVVPFLDA
jgi:hypothetical protein